MNRPLLIISFALVLFGCGKIQKKTQIPLVKIPAGIFRMGNITDYPDGRNDEKPVHKVRITHSFFMGRTEVTQAQWKAVMGSNPSRFKGDNRPVDNVNWYDAVQFCNRLSRQDSLEICYTGDSDRTVCNFNAKGYRLPTEAEWEYACRGGTATDFHTGNMPRSAHSDSANYPGGWHDANSGDQTHDVGLKQPSAFGLFDMHGNVWEWCWDWYQEDYYDSWPYADPRGPAAARTYRVLRGGSWYYSANDCRSAYRGCDDPDTRSSSGGFRVVRTQ
jgi:formylglycine-generating enzyme